ncbi:23S rRNA pseudouridine(2605) synthase RluB [Moraxella pluranimalium]|uniref:Pseudouridine synthase n=1 Tax=Moraxella pluranimalium TaxID=470453 RepID=A0A1T0CR67_9GAMM|nr:pseudouridine synthase [Moraxella pluranimalium]OOS24719.1 23S rRNA pseudouridylate synthase B [Moraxella pluranimalium]
MTEQFTPDITDNIDGKPVGEKLQKLLARIGLGSRRGLEEIIKAGRISINGKVATLGDRATLTDEIRVDGRPVRLKAEREKRRRVLAYYKPEGEICSVSDPEGRPTVFDRLPKLTGDRWVMVGRLDINSSGLLLFTNDGELAHRLMHPSSQVVREYAVRVLGEVTPQIASTLTAGVELEDGFAKFDDIKEGGGTGVNKWYHVTIKEGRKREVRRMFESQALKVSRLIRTRYGTMILPKELRTGRFIELDAKEIGKLVESVGLRQRQGTGLNTATKEKQARIHKKPLKSREVRRKKHEEYERRQERQERRPSQKTPSFKTAKFVKID